MNIMKTNMLMLDNKFMKEDAGNTSAQAPVPSTEKPQEGMKALSFMGMKNLMADPKLAKEVGVMNNTSAPYSSNITFQGKFDAGKKFAQMLPAGLIALSAIALSSCEKDIKMSQTQEVNVDLKAVVDAINALREEIKANNNAQTEREKEMLQALNNALNVLYKIQTEVKNQTLSIEDFKTLVLGKMDNGELQRSAILEAIIKLQGITEDAAISVVSSILTAYESGKIDFQTAMAKIQALLKENNDILKDIREKLNNHFNKYDNDMAEIKALAKDIKVEQKATKEEVQKLRTDVKNFADAALSMSKDIKGMTVDLKEIKAEIQKGVKFDDSEIQALLKKINATQNMSKEEIIAKMDEFINKQDGMAADLEETNKLIAKLNYIVSNDVIEAINNIGVNLEGLKGINDKLDELIAAVKALTTSFNLHAKFAVDAHAEEMDALNGIKSEFKNVDKKLDELIEQGKTADKKRDVIIEYLKGLQDQADEISVKLDRIPTVDEFDIMLSTHDANNQKYYGDLIKAAGIDPAEFENIKDLLKAINENLVDFQGTSNKLLADILARIKAMDPTAPDYTEKLNKIIDLMENFKFECNCKCDCDHNQAVDEGIIDIIG